MVKYGELDKAISKFTCSGVPENIPVEYYRRMIRIAIKMHNDGKHWDMHQAALVLLYIAFHDEHLHPSQLTASGLKALDHAEKLLQDNTMVRHLLDEMSGHSLRLKSG